MLLLSPLVDCSLRCYLFRSNTALCHAIHYFRYRISQLIVFRCQALYLLTLPRNLMLTLIFLLNKFGSEFI